MIDGGAAGGDGTQTRGTGTGGWRPERGRTDGDMNGLNADSDNVT